VQAHPQTNGKNGSISGAASADPHAEAGRNLAYLGETVGALRRTFESGVTRSYEWRLRQLEGLARLLASEEKAIVEALGKDVGKPRIEAWAAEVSECAGGVRYMRKNLKKWMKPERVTTSMVAMPGKSRIYREPLGVVLIIAPWNYPFSLAINPLMGALAAGNCALIKPSEVAPATSALLAELLPKYLDSEAVKVVEGGVPETTELLAQKFDHIFYTGNGTVGRIVMTAAAKHLTPVTLELGGKSPCIIDEHVDLEVAAKRVVWGKFYNCGQTCVAPDYLLVHKSVHDRFVSLLVETIHAFWGDNPQQHKDYGRVVNARHHKRLMSLIPGSGTVAIGGKGDEADRYIAPTLLTHVSEDAPVMQDEIFGPILPVLQVDDLDHAVRVVNARPKPLALYLFSSSDRSYEKVVTGTSSGGMVVNHAILHLAVHGLPFGGVGESGMGAYHGKHSFDTFSHKKAVLKKPTAIDPSLIYPPYTEAKEGWMRRLM
jgi:aldehyde dehydrogenase (NAD+)